MPEASASSLSSTGNNKTRGRGLEIPIERINWEDRYLPRYQLTKSDHDPTATRWPTKEQLRLPREKKELKRVSTKWSRLWPKQYLLISKDPRKTPADITTKRISMGVSGLKKKEESSWKLKMTTKIYRENSSGSGQGDRVVEGNDDHERKLPLPPFDSAREGGWRK